MKILVVVARILLGLIFFVFGLNAFVPFTHGAPPTTGFAGAFISAMIGSHFVLFVGAFQLVGGALLLSNRFLPLGLALLAPVIANILAYHIAMQVSGLSLGIFVAVLWAFLAWKLRAYFAPLFVQKAEMS